ncbi:CPBP family intramembrane metalloprotease [Bacillus aquiflavi]|uniref:CPBP family intramembrane metalloprotease n=1 Tax=Bacillus aquiflavi TaxID=2672567 RepID=A0A6B3W181_9BACI|nr:type II CAAX endopeptidase family protein [Bacillus aquiflavi]MBA4537385.1 CPBP family intramembrane metalloprotease [Bacillus aquiflavi]NEY81641.1 CPBP family intramembrane metalloprotease [Bacillus aquiflavi]UAC49204.1 CPBP family intramembrane metalloprotease [Bacillus aquiflavi]
MKKCASDLRLIIGFFIAHLLLFLTFEDKSVFWYIFSASMLFLISYSILNEEMDDQAPVSNYLFYGIISGLLLYTVFWVGNSMINFFDLPFSKQVSRLYNRYAPTELWHYIVLLFILIPGEEIFWRGFIQKRILKYTNIWISIFVSALLYASVQIYAGHSILILAAFVGGLFWGALYTWKRSIPLIIVSHLTFDLMIFIFLPLY